MGRSGFEPDLHNKRPEMWLFLTVITKIYKYTSYVKDLY